MVRSKSNITRKYNKDVNRLQENLSALNPIIHDIFLRLEASHVPAKNRLKILNLVRKLSSEQVGKVVVRIIPHLGLKIGSYREVESKVGYSYVQIRKWVKQFAPELFIERAGKVGDRT